MSSETLVLSSELSKDTHPENNGGCFTTDLGTPLLFGSNGYVKINDLAYVPGTWDNVRENSNEITLKMRGYPIWGLGPATIYHAGETTWEKGNRKKYTRNTDKQKFRLVDVFRLIITRNEIMVVATLPVGTVRKQYTSDWMPGNPFDGKDGERGTPIFRTITTDLPWNVANSKSMDIQRMGKFSRGNEWQISKCYLPCKYYTHFPDFQLAFVKCVSETIEKMLVAGDAHPSIHELRKIKPMKYDHFSDGGTAPESTWVFLQEFQKTPTTTVSLIKISKLFRNTTDLQIILNPIMEQQLGLVDKPQRLGALPLSLTELRPVKRQMLRRKPDRWAVKQMYNPLTIFLTGGDEWDLDNDGDLVVATFNFYGATTIDLNRNDVKSMWIFCDIVDASLVDGVQIPLLQIVPVTNVDCVASFERFGMAYRKRINKSRVDTIKIWITETFDGKPIHFNDPVVISLQIDA